MGGTLSSLAESAYKVGVPCLLGRHRAWHVHCSCPSGPDDAIVVVPGSGVAGMSEERFAGIESRLDELSQGQQELKGDVRQLKADVRELKVDVNELKADVSGLKADVSGLKADVGGLKTDVGALKTDVHDLKAGQVDLRRHMSVLHEEVLDRIQALAFDPEPLRREFQAGIAGLREELILRIEPLEAAARRKNRR
jgi:chromosome segregation ATPase